MSRGRFESLNRCAKNHAQTLWQTQVVQVRPDLRSSRNWSKGKPFSTARSMTFYCECPLPPYWIAIVTIVGSVLRPPIFS